MKRSISYFLFLLLTFASLTVAYAQSNQNVYRSNANSADIQIDANQYISPTAKNGQQGQTESTYNQPESPNYTLGANDVVQIDVLRHPEFSDKFSISEDGMIQYKYMGDILVKGLTKQQLEDKIKEAVSKYVVSPEVSVTILEYGSKVFYMMGEVASPGQFIMKSEGISLRDAIHLAGLPTINASLRKCRLVTPSNDGKQKIENIDLYALLYYGDLRKNVIIKPGDIFYVPSTAVTKFIRVISPITTAVGLSTSPVENVASAKTALHDLKKNLLYNQ